MSSTDLEAPSRKLLLAAIIIVVGLHVLTAIALAAVKTPELKVEPKKDTPPIEIELISLPAEPEVEVVEVAPKEEPRPQVAEPQPPKPKAEPVVRPKPKAPEKPVVIEKKTTPKPAPTVPVEKQEVKEEPKELLVDPKIAAANEQRRIIAAEAERAAQQAQAQKDRNDQAARDAQEQAARDAQAKAAAEAKAIREAAEAAAQAKATRDAQAKAAADAKAAAAASNTPQNFTATNADWASAPRFSFPDRAARNARSGETFTVVLRLRVNKQGGIDSVSLSKSSGNTAVDKEAQRQVRSGKFKPFTKNGVPVVGNVTLPVSYQVP